MKMLDRTKQEIDMRGIVHFREDLERKAREFEHYWMAQREKAPDKADWPLRMAPEEWWEQYVVWLTTVENKGREAAV